MLSDGHGRFWQKPARGYYAPLGWVKKEEGGAA
jgi:hypothetical protein